MSFTQIPNLSAFPESSGEKLAQIIASGEIHNAFRAMFGLAARCSSAGSGDVQPVAGEDAALNLQKLRGEFWVRWTEIKTDIDMGLASLDHDGGKILHADMLANTKSRGSDRLAKAKAG